MSLAKLNGWRTLGICLWLTLPGCTATIAEPAYARVEYVPEGIYTYPSTTYQGQVVYLVDGRWYYQRGRDWLYFYREPEPLRRYRVDRYRAPPVHPQSRPRYVAPPAHRYVAPPARRPNSHAEPRRPPPARPRSEHERRSAPRDR